MSPRGRAPRGAAAAAPAPARRGAEKGLRKKRKKGLYKNGKKAFRGPLLARPLQPRVVLPELLQIYSALPHAAPNSLIYIEKSALTRRRTSSSSTTKIYMAAPIVQ